MTRLRAVALGGTAVTLAVLGLLAFTEPPTRDQIVLLVGAMPFLTYLALREILVVRFDVTSVSPETSVTSDLSQIAIVPLAILMPPGAVGLWIFVNATAVCLGLPGSSTNPLSTRALYALLSSMAAATAAAMISVVCAPIFGTGGDIGRAIAAVSVGVIVHLATWCTWDVLFCWTLRRPWPMLPLRAGVALLPLVTVASSLLVLAYDPRNPAAILLAVAVCVVLHGSIRLSFRSMVELRHRVHERDELRRIAMTVAEVERKRLAFELHESALQSALVAKMQAERLHGGEAVTEAITRTADDLRHVMRGSLPAAVVPGPFNDAVLVECQHVLNGSSSTVKINVDVDEATAAAYREVLLFVVREAVRNAAKHAAADNVDVTVRSHRKGVEARVVDDGVGFDTSKLLDARDRGHFGLDWLRQWVEVAGGTVSIQSSIGAGTAIVAALPASGNGSVAM